MQLNVFPGVTVRCGCGTELTVPYAAPASTTDSPYRVADQPASAPPPPSEDFVLRAGYCPRCTGVELDASGDRFECHRCHGMFISHARLYELVEHHRARGVAPIAEPAPNDARVGFGDVTYLRCPACDASMTRRRFGAAPSFIVDVCNLHGIWLDPGELEAVLVFTRALPAESSARALLEGLVQPPLPPVSERQVELPLLLQRLGKPYGVRGAGAEDIEDVERLMKWISRLFRWAP